VRALLAIAVAQVRTKWKLALIPIAFGLLFQILRGLGFGLGSNQFRMTSATVGVALALVVAALLGLDVVASDLRARRLPFFLSRPCPLWQLWCGRFLGSLLVLSLAWVGGRMMIVAWGATSAELAFPALLVFLLLLMNSVACVLGSLAVDALCVDLVATSVFATLVYQAVQWFVEIGGPLLIFNEAVSVVFPPAIGTLCVGLLAAGLAFLCAGRGRAAWGHRFHSWTFWPIILGSLILGLSICQRQEMGTTLPDILRYSRARPLDAQRFLVFEWGSAYGRVFAVDATTGQSERVPAWSYARVLSNDGVTAAWIREDANGVRRLVIARSDTLGQPFREVDAPAGDTDLADISNEADRALFIARSALVVWDAVSGTRVASVKTTGRPAVLARFGDDHPIEAEFWDDAATRRIGYRFDGTIIREQRIERPFRALLKEHEATGRRAFVEGDGVVLRDREGRTIATVKGKPPSLLFTRSGTLLVWAHGTLTIIGVDDPTPRVLPVSGITGTILGELDSGEVLLRTFEKVQNHAVLVDPRSVSVTLSIDGVRPVLDISRATWAPWDATRGTGPIRALSLDRSHENASATDAVLRAFQNDDGDLMYLDRGAKALRLLVKSNRADF
jgi:hypothetical protein